MASPFRPKTSHAAAFDLPRKCRLRAPALPQWCAEVGRGVRRALWNQLFACHREHL